jgi:hypothetical protein
MSKTVIERIDEALKELPKSTLYAPTRNLFEAARKELVDKQVEQKQISLDNTKAVYEAYRGMHKKLEEIGRQFCEARVPNAKAIHLMRWWYHDGRNNDNEVLSLELEYRRTEVEDDEDSSRPDGYDGFGQGYVSRRFDCYVKPEWLWQPEALEKEIRIAGLQAELDRAAKRAADQFAAIPKRQADVDELAKNYRKTCAHQQDLIERIAELKK